MQVCVNERIVGVSGVSQKECHLQRVFQNRSVATGACLNRSVALDVRFCKGVSPQAFVFQKGVCGHSAWLKSSVCTILQRSVASSVCFKDKCGHRRVVEK